MKLKNKKQLEEFLSDFTKEDFYLDRSNNSFGAEYKSERSNYCYWRSGATKAVETAVFDDVVIKIPFKAIKLRDRMVREVFTDYCELEYSFYKKSIEYKVSSVLAPIYKVYSESLEMYVYIQKKVENIGYIPGISEETISEVESKGLHFKEMPDELCYSICEYYGSSFLTRLLDFFENFGINDIHNSNFGSDSMGRAVIFDYSGYYGLD